MLAAHAERMPSAAPTGHFLNTLWSRLGATLTAGADRMFQAWCGLSGHTLAYHFEPTRISLHCLNCGHHTPGWAIAAQAHRPR